ncbi:hypothetical protein AQI94_22555 [Streptomyces pseudovenezuelae]|uniref:Uncharacterized protein n=1 Tax=Streptomyces pseudovenezuelae TaxID=67350 RepID=A0A117PQR7_9ACTN|nr:hypothetical protein AQI94_22555 [Streptomyces pseudovenezuelae]
MSTAPTAPTTDRPGAAHRLATLAADVLGGPLPVRRLYLVGGALAFEEGRMGVDQILGVRPGTDGDSGMTAGASGWYEGLDRL